MGLNSQRGNKLYMDKAWLIDNYWNKRKTMQELAKISKSCYVTIWIWMNKYNIKRRNPKQSCHPREANWVNLTEEFVDFLNGLLLGDGCLTIGKAKSAYYTHGDKNREYIEWLSSKFESFGVNGRVRKYKNKEAYSFKSFYYYGFYRFAKKWYPNGKKRIPHDFFITPNSLKNWYIGDGNFSRMPLIDSSIFSFKDLKRITDQLIELGLKLQLKEFKDRKRLNFLAESKNDFFKYILSNDSIIPPGYEYKFPREVI